MCCFCECNEKPSHLPAKHFNLCLYIGAINFEFGYHIFWIGFVHLICLCLSLSSSCGHEIFFIKFPFKHPPKTTEKNTEIKKSLRINWIIKHFPRYMQTLNFSRFMTFESHLPEIIERLSGVQMMNRVTEMSGIIFMLPKILFSVRLIRLPLLISF